MNTRLQRIAAVIALSTASAVALSGCMVQLPSGNSTPAQTQSAPTQAQPQQQQTSGLSASQRERNYLDAAAAAYVDPLVASLTESDTLATGYAACDAYADGASRSTLTSIANDALSDRELFRPNAGAIVVDAALDHLC